MLPQRCRHAAVIARVQVAVVAVVATEELIPTVAADDYFYMLLRQLGDMVGAEREGIGRLIEVVDEIRQQGDERGGERTLVMLSVIKTRNSARVWCLIETRMRQAHSEGG